MSTAFQKFALISTKVCQYNENKSCLNEYAETNKLFLTAIWTIIVRVTLSSISLQNILTILNAYKTGNIHIIWHWDIFMEPLLHWKSNIYYIYWVCVCRLRNLVRNDLAPYCHMVPVQLHNIFPHYLINGIILSKTSYWTQKVCFDFL